jgi:GDPmannose 4,6-dehydratase
VWGSSRDAELSAFQNLKRLGIFESVKLVSMNLRDITSVIGVLRRICPHDVFSLAGQSSVGLSFDQPVETIESVAIGTLTLLEAIRLSNIEIRFYNAGSTECFGDTGEVPANELTQFHPRSPYAVAKASSYWMVANYREAYGMFACTGILSNHDSALRPGRFVTRKIIHAAASVSLGNDAVLSLGNLAIERDWGWAPEYVEAVTMMLEQTTPQDLVIATGKTHSLTEYAETAFRLVGKDWRKYVKSDDGLMRPTDISRSRLDPSRAASVLGWRAKVGMEQSIAMMLESEIEELRNEHSRQFSLAGSSLDQSPESQ